MAIDVWLQLNHDNVIPVYGLTLGFGPLPAVVCPWMKNGTLTRHLEDSADQITASARKDIVSGILPHTIDVSLTELYSSGKSFLDFVIVRLTFPHLLGPNLALVIVHDHGVIHGSLSGVRVTGSYRTTLNHELLLVEYIHRRSRTSMCGRLRNGSSTNGIFQRDLLLFIHRRRGAMDWTRTLSITRQIKQLCGFP